MPRIRQNTYIAIYLRQLPGHAADLSACTFALEEEDHTMGNVIRYSEPANVSLRSRLTFDTDICFITVLMKKLVAFLEPFIFLAASLTLTAAAPLNSPDVEFCGYSAPHPSEYKIHLRVQMFDHKSALDALSKGLCDLEDLFTVLQEKYAEDFNKGQYETITPEEINWEEVKAKAQAVSALLCSLLRMIEALISALFRSTRTRRPRRNRTAIDDHQERHHYPLT